MLSTLGGKPWAKWQGGKAKAPPVATTWALLGHLTENYPTTWAPRVAEAISVAVLDKVIHIRGSLIAGTLTNGHKLFPQGSGKRWFCEQAHTPHTTHREVLPVPGDATLKNHSPVGKDVSLRQPFLLYVGGEGGWGVASNFGYLKHWGIGYACELLFVFLPAAAEFIFQVVLCPPPDPPHPAPPLPRGPSFLCIVVVFPSSFPFLLQGGKGGPGYATISPPSIF